MESVGRLRYSVAGDMRRSMAAIAVGTQQYEGQRDRDSLLCEESCDRQDDMPVAASEQSESKPTWTMTKRLRSISCTRQELL
jgi:hypothetical protein